VRLTRKYSEAIDGVDLSQSKVGDRLRLSERDASLLIAEGWATPCDGTPSPPRRQEKGRAAREALRGRDPQ
jgi:hypothetical protein